MRILKFGGSTLKTPETCRLAAGIIRAAHRKGPIVVVVSALYGVTNRLIALVDAAKTANTGAWRKVLRDLIAHHQDTLDALVPKSRQKTVRESVDALFAELGELCDGISQLQECSPRTRDRVIGFGELLSSQIIAAALAHQKLPAVAVDARGFLVRS